MSPEEFFMYLTIALIVIAPVGARLYRLFTLRKTQAMLREQFGESRPDARPRERVSMVTARMRCILMALLVAMPACSQGESPPKSAAPRCRLTCRPGKPSSKPTARPATGRRQWEPVRALRSCTKSMNRIIMGMPPSNAPPPMVFAPTIGNLATCPRLTPSARTMWIRSLSMCGGFSNKLAFFSRSVTVLSLLSPGIPAV